MSSLRIHQLIFAEPEIIFIVQRKEDGETFICASSELFTNDTLLSNFSFADIRLISYFAAQEEFTLDKNYLNQQEH